MGTNNYNEPELIRGLAAGSATAFDSLYHRYYEPVRSNIFKVVRNEEVTDDLLQDVFSRLWEKRESFANYKGIGGWLFVSSYNRSINFLHRQTVEKTYQNSLRLTKPYEESLEDEARFEKQLRLLEAAIEQMPPQRKKVFELVRFGGRSYEQAARELSISKNTVKEHLARATESITSFVKNNSPDPDMLALIFFLLSAPATHPFLAHLCF